MALGKVESIDPNNDTIGTIKEDESEQIYPYNDPIFKTKGLQVGSPCTYDIDYSAKQPIATNLFAYTPTEVEITTTVSGPLSVKSGETLKVRKGGMVNGTIVVDNGNLFVEDTGGVTGNITINNQGSFIVRKGGMVNGTIVVDSGSACKIVNKGNVNGTIVIASANRLIIGNANGGGIVSGGITIDKIRKVIITATSTINCRA